METQFASSFSSAALTTTQGRNTTGRPLRTPTPTRHSRVWRADAREHIPPQRRQQPDSNRETQRERWVLGGLCWKSHRRRAHHALRAAQEAESGQSPGSRSPRGLGTRAELPRTLQRSLPALRSADPSACPEPALVPPPNRPLSQRLEDTGHRAPRERSRDGGSGASVPHIDCRLCRLRLIPPRGEKPISLRHQRLNAGARFPLAPSVRQNRKINLVYKLDGT